MPRYKKPGTGRDFQPGQSGNPAGRRPDPPELKAIKKMSKGEFDLMMHKFMHLTQIELGKIISDPNSKAPEAILASIAAQAIKQGDPGRFTYFSDRLFGKVKDEINVTHDFSNMTDQELAQEIEKTLKEFKKTRGNDGSES